MIARKLLFDFYLVILITGNLLFDFYFMYFVILTGSLLQRNLTQFLRAVLSNLLLDNFFQGSTVRTAVFHATCRIHCWLYLSVFLTNLLICLVCIHYEQEWKIKTIPVVPYLFGTQKSCDIFISSLSFWFVCWDCPCSVKAFFQASGYYSSSFFKLSRHLF